MMSIFKKVTLEILKKNKIRTIVTIIGIILSASMFTAVTTTISTLQNFMLRDAIYEIEHRDIGNDNPASFVMKRILPMPEKKVNKLHILSIVYEEKEGCQYEREFKE